MPIEISRFKSFGEYTDWWENFTNYHDRSIPDGIGWIEYYDYLLKDIAHYKLAQRMISFNSEEDMIRFILEWS